ncbi:MAG TPA: cytochrome-c oxidase, cbb3-type subunit III [Accumulibacter sp.]|uniref:Cbb3-type cytochrome c oxidase subunit n=2 Tax=Candidatus Accumulibacter TaxID=327159 RepID=A0A080M8X8_9PROT|nr:MULTISPECIES: cytochrome-c oxidase, cbb3-type subunit III [Candidatus Accumulibacter]HNL90288.1 cytochrome-c oxidase, cbb3-type subunit III [Nitrospira sp.]KFB77698.1 MAG: Cytochrome c oxidase subunit III [Candidatus Accumulibacter cognatus]MBL8399782.1 cytochrome-c oxidase, cbb3-type subunit III [Accumulibacter sp.]MBN8517431.1 cytochrome-c oxidase, cbb3-type subunit III [Accumulibacter sp.]MBO3710635.1 cytochrome-c oxidase, cbb3-type subunit III [Accumulibacter sp.]
MNDFVNQFWNWYVILFVLVSIIACGVLLWMQSVPTGGKGDTTGHVWDETLEEYNNPLPKWWMWLFYITVIFGLVYCAFYPALGSFQGMLGWSSSGQLTKELAKADEQTKPLYDKYMKMDLRTLAADKEGNETGKRLYLTYCMQCHGADARGSKGFPNLADHDWQWGGEPEAIVQTISAGRVGMMPPHAQIGAETIKDLANYVRSLSGLPADSLRVAKGQEAFNSVGCSGCHGPDAKGMQALGAPNLTDKIWLYGSAESSIIETITKGRTNQMPAWKDFLGEEKVHVLAAYVLSLSTGSK